MAVSVTIPGLKAYRVATVEGLQFRHGVAETPGLSDEDRERIVARFPDAVIRLGSGALIEGDPKPAKLFDLPGLDDRAMPGLAERGVSSAASFAATPRETLLEVDYITEKNVDDLLREARAAAEG